MIYFIAILSFATTISCNVKISSTTSNKGANEIIPVSLINLENDQIREFAPYIIHHKPTHISIFEKNSGGLIKSNKTILRMYFPDKKIYVDIKKDNDQITSELPKFFDRNHMIYFGNFFVPTPVPTPTPQPKVTKKKTKRKIVKNAIKIAPTPTPVVTETKIVWTKDRVALEILKGNSPRDTEGNLVHRATGKETLKELVEWHCESAEHLELVSNFNGGLPVDAPIVEGVEVKIPEHLVRNPKKFKLD
ncbi:MAG: hypothetical protein NZO16_03810 [Deltaproteobacteria bacterium]|nr:hypothetical protein [Deltaproteobacteria bacterium]